MTQEAGRALWQVYEDAVSSIADRTDNGVTAATLDFIKGFEAEIFESRLELHSSTGSKIVSDKLHTSFRP